MNAFENYWRTRSLIYATERSMAREAFEAGMKRAAEIAESGCRQVRYAIEVEVENGD